MSLRYHVSLNIFLKKSELIFYFKNNLLFVQFFLKGKMDISLSRENPLCMQY